MEKVSEIRVLQIFSNLGIGGAETWLIAFLTQLNKVSDQLPYRIQVDICLTGTAKGVYDDEARRLGARLFYTEFSKSNLWKFTNEFREILRNGKYCAIHDHQDCIAGIHFFIGLGLLPKIRIAHVHNPLIHVESYSNNLIRKITVLIGKRLLSIFATHILGTSQQVIDEYGFNHPRFKNIKRSALYCGFDVTRFNKSHKFFYYEVCNEFDWGYTAKISLFVGRLDSNLNQKNPMFALNVAKKCISLDPNFRMIIVGEGKNRIDLERTVKKWKLSKYIKLTGPRSDIPRLMAGAHILLFPSVAEGLGMVAVEAQAAGLRVLASTAVPKESKVICGMIKFKSLEDGDISWAEETLRIMQIPRADYIKCNRTLDQSQFSIQNSTSNLINLYTALN